MLFAAIDWLFCYGNTCSIHAASNKSETASRFVGVTDEHIFLLTELQFHQTRQRPQSLFDSAQNFK